MRKTGSLFVLWALALLPARAQQPYFKSFTVQDGLVANPVRCIYQDREGLIWIGTYEGLSRYDGYKFTNYTTGNGLSHNFVNGFFQLGGELLIAENNGAIDAVTREGIRRKFLLESAVNLIATLNGRLLFTTDNSGLYEYRDGKPQRLQPRWNGLALGHAVEYNDSLLLVDGVDNLVFFTKALQPWRVVQSPGHHFYFLCRDSRNRLWAGTSHGLKLLPPAPGKAEPFSFRPLPRAFDFPLLRNAEVRCMAEEKGGGFWIGTNKGLVHLSPDGRYQVYNEKDGLPSSTINTLYFDREANLWIGTSLGLARWASRNSVLVFNTEKDGFRNDVGTMLVLPGQHVVLNTAQGLQQFNPGAGTFTDLRAGACVPVEGTWPLQVIRNNVIGFPEPVSGRIRTLRKLPLTGVYAATRHPAGPVFLCTTTGLFAFDGSDLKKLLPYRITALAADSSGYLWAGTWVNGLYRVAVHPGRDPSYEIEDLTALAGCSEIRGLYCDSRNNTWVGTRYAGAFCLMPGSNGSYRVKNFSRESGLLSNWVQSFSETGGGDIWVGNYLGLDRLVRQGQDYRVFSFSKVTNFFAQVQAIGHLGGNRWICHANSSIAIFRDEALHASPPLQSLVLSAVFGPPGNRLTVPAPLRELRLAHSQNTARFEFSALGFINEKQVLFSYRLSGGGDTAWSRPENVHEASYVSLPPGRYRFEVRTVGWNGAQGAPAFAAFSIEAPFWKQGWFYALCIAFVALLFYLLYRYRIRQLLHLQQVRNGIATDLHDDIGSTLTNISILSALSHRHLGQPEKAGAFLERISEEVQSSSQALDDIIWSVNSRNDSLPETMARMRRYAAELFDNSDVHCHLQLEEGGQKKLSMEQRRDVYLIYKEVLNNIHKHARAANVWIEVLGTQNGLHMEIRDDGRGFDMTAESHRNGLKNLRSRVRKWKGTITITSAPGSGTCVGIRIPLKE